MHVPAHETFSFRSPKDLLDKAAHLGLELPWSEDVSTLFQSIRIGSRLVPNRLAVQPMEGFDADEDGTPGDLTFRRYKRYAEGGFGLIWFEATSVVPEGRSNPHQLMIHEQNLGRFGRLVESTRGSAARLFGASHNVFLVLQLTHSGRYSRPWGIPAPQAACANPLLDKPGNHLRILNDSDLDRLQECYAAAARVASAAGFDAVDLKACHGYLLNELLAAHNRKNSRYGKNFVNRTRFLLEILRRIRSEIQDLGLAVRMNAFDGLPYPFGFGMSKERREEIDLDEPRRVVRLLAEQGCTLINITAGNPHLYPHLGRPYDRPVFGASFPEEHPLEGVVRLLRVTAELQKASQGVPCVGTGFSWLRQFFPHVGAAVIDRGEARLIGLGRSALAYPEAPRDLMDSGRLDPRKVCIACSRCSELTRALHQTGCVTRDKEVYAQEYKHVFGTDANEA